MLTRKKVMRDYVDLRVQANALTLSDHAESGMLTKTVATQTVLWGYARQAITQEPNAHAPALFVQAINELIDSFGRHVPELVLLLVFVILDLDRPRRGLIKVSQKSLVELQQPCMQIRTRRPRSFRLRQGLLNT
jgi:hypothetical protein